MRVPVNMHDASCMAGVAEGTNICVSSQIIQAYTVISFHYSIRHHWHVVILKYKSMDTISYYSS